MVIRISPRIDFSEYDSFSRIISPNDEFPATYYEWIERCLAEDKKAIARGEMIKEVVVDYEGFVSYCTNIGQSPNSSILAAYAVAKFSKNQ